MLSVEELKKGDAEFLSKITPLLPNLYVAMDLEWEIETKFPRLFSLAYRVPNANPAEWEGRSFIYCDDTMHILEEALRKSKGLIFHNAKADLDILECNGHEIETLRHKVHDTMLMAHLVDEIRRKGLKVRAPDVGMVLKELDEVDQGNLEEFMNYNRDDSIATVKLFYKYGATLKRDDLLIAYELERQCLYPTMRMEQTGFYVDKDKTLQLEKLAKDRIEYIEGELFKANGDSFNPGSSKQLAVFLFKTLGIKQDKKWVTDAGSVSTSASVLEELYEREKGGPNGEILTLLMEYRSLRKVVSTYVGQAILQYIAADGMIHANFSQVGTVTGRFSCSEPNLQNQPKDPLFKDNLDTLIRKQYIAPPGKKLVVIDYSQIELRIMAYLSQDTRMIEVYANDEDLHDDMAKFAGVDRDFAKTLNFGMAYGLVEKTFAANTGLPLKKVQEMYAKHEERFPGLYKMFGNIRQFTRDNGYTITMSGRRRRIPEIYSENFVEKAHAQRQAVNTTIQGSAGDLIKLAMINIYDNTNREEIQIVAQVHDELLLYIPDCGKDQEYLEKIQSLFETAMVVKSMRFKAEGKICSTWADKNIKAPKVAA